MNPLKEKALKILNHRDWTPPPDFKTLRKYAYIIALFDFVLIVLLATMHFGIISPNKEIISAGLSALICGTPCLIIVFLTIILAVKIKTRLHIKYSAPEYDWAETFRVR